MFCVIDGEPKSCNVQKHKVFASERYTADFLYADCYNRMRPELHFAENAFCMPHRSS